MKFGKSCQANTSQLYIIPTLHEAQIELYQIFSHPPKEKVQKISM